jgi:hypothetical protein
MTRRLRNLVFGGVVLGLVGATVPTRADVTDRTMYITFNRPVALPGVELRAGTYVFELAAPTNTNALVRVTSKNRDKVYLMAFTVGVDRPRSMRADQVVTLGEAAPGKAPRIHVWFPAGESQGRQFIYDE